MYKKNWRIKILKEKKREIISSTIITLLVILSVSFWHLFSGQSFEWQSINPIEAPTIFSRLFYSALVYVTLGAVLYASGFYKFLYSLYQGVYDGWRAYKEMKGLIWFMLILIMCFVIIPVVVDIGNAVISFIYNIYFLLLYIAPAIGIALIVSIPICLITMKFLKPNQ